MRITSNIVYTNSIYNKTKISKAKKKLSREQDRQIAPNENTLTIGGQFDGSRIFIMVRLFSNYLQNIKI